LIDKRKRYGWKKIKLDVKTKKDKGEKERGAKTKNNKKA